MTKAGARLAASVAAIGGGVLVYALVEAQSYVVRHVTVPVAPPGSRPLRILHLSDLHLTGGWPSRRRAVWIRALRATKPDLVVLTGDNFARADGLPVILDALAPLLTCPGAFVFGSNDYVSARWRNPARYVAARILGRDMPDAGSALSEDQFDLPWTDLRDALTRAGWLDLNNARAQVTVAGSRVRLVGLDDPHIGRDRLPSREGEGFGKGGAAIVLGVVHAPYQRALRALADDGAHLVLAGHTHGGQVALPGYGALVANCDLGTARARGLHGWPGPRPDAPGGEASIWLHVSCGLGTSPYAPVRVAARPEAVLLTLVASGRAREESGEESGE